MRILLTGAGGYIGLHIVRELLEDGHELGATKAAGELFLRAACAEHQMTGVVNRPGPVVGPPAFAGGAFRSDPRLAQTS